VVLFCINSSGGLGYWIEAGDGLRAGDGVGSGDSVGVSRDVDVDSSVNEDGEAGIDSIAMMYCSVRLRVFINRKPGLRLESARVFEMKEPIFTLHRYKEI
jgi:hypothetical protein